MIPRDIIDELGESLGICDQTILIRRINRAVELLSAKDLFDPLTGYLNFHVDSGNFIALPREVRAVLAVNLNSQPAFARSRFYEFDLNTPGSVPGDSIEYEWNDRCNVFVQDERRLPGYLKYRCSSEADNGGTCTIEGRDATGRIISETLTADNETPVQSTKVFHEITRVFRSQTGGECFVYSNGELIAQYYGDETEPVYRSIRLSKHVVAVRIMFRREPLKITTLDSYIPLNSPMAVIEAAKAVGYLAKSQDDMADVCLARAEKFIKEDQSSREDGDKLAERQTVGTLGAGLGHSEGVTVIDVYDTFCEIFGRIGRNVIFKKISQCIQVLIGKAHWDGLLGMVDIWPRSNDAEINPHGGTGDGYYTLPRFIGTPLKVNLCGEPMQARNRWFDFHLNGLGERNTASVNKWDDIGETPLMDNLARFPGKDAGNPIPTKVVAVCENSLDVGKLVRIYGRELLSNGQVAEVWRGGELGWICPCLSALADPGDTAPMWVEIDRIERAETRGFVRLWAVKGTFTPGTALVETTTVNDGFAISGVWTGEPASLRAFFEFQGGSGNCYMAVYGDEARTVQVAHNLIGVHVLPLSTWGLVFTLNGQTFTGTIRRLTLDTPIDGTLTLTVTPAVAGSWSLAATRLLGFWYPDEIEPSYRVIRLPTTHPKRIRVLYRRRFKRICSLFDHIPLRSSLAIENMARALKAQEMGMIENAEPLEMKAVQYLSEDRIKEGESEMGSLEFDMHTGPGGWENLS